MLTPEGFSSEATMIVVGEVVSEESWPDRPNIFDSTVRVAATLLGDPQEVVYFPALGVQWGDCSGGARLIESERVVLFAYPKAMDPLTGRYRGEPDDSGWQIAVMGYGRYTLHDDQAWLEHRSLAPDPVRREMKVADDLIREIAALHNSDADEVERALAFVRGGPVESDVSARGLDEDTLVVVGGVLGLMLLVIVVAVVTRRRGTI